MVTMGSVVETRTAKGRKQRCQELGTKNTCSLMQEPVCALDKVSLRTGVKVMKLGLGRCVETR